ncbi:MAG: TlyA family RNA methyltransferase [Candidatus Caccovivens sp.]
MRLDLLLVEKGVYPTRAKAKQAVEMGRVLVNGKVVTKPAFVCEENTILQGLPFEFVSRGGFKLQKALETFNIDLSNKVVLDIGASTGGFSDVCLQAGASKVYAVDTGEGQLIAKIKFDPRVLNYEKTNYLSMQTPKDVDFVCIDVSFVSLTKFAPKLASDFENKSIEIVALIKPQFECGLDYAKKHKGIVKDEKMHKKIIDNITSTFENCGFEKFGLIESPIKGGDGNTEFLIWLKKKESD